MRWFFFASRDLMLTLVTGLSSSNSGWRTQYFFVSGEGWEYPPGEEPEVKFNRAWVSVIIQIGTSSLYCCLSHVFSFFSIFESVLFFPSPSPFF